MFNFTPSTIPHNIFVIGAGGTGGRLMPLLAQFLRSITRGRSATGWVESPNIWIIDDDIVEQKNILRQNFIEPDVGKHKASVLAERYSRAYGVNIVPILEKITSDNRPAIHSVISQTIQAMSGSNHGVNVNQIFDSSIVIICVDSVEARRDILNTFITKTGAHLSGRTFFIDAGNEDNFGQISFFNPVIITEAFQYDLVQEQDKLPKLLPVSADVDFIPIDFDYYRNLEDTPAQGSCADLNQTLAINAIMATTIMGIVQNYYYRKPMTYNTISISLDGGNATTYNTFNVFKNRSIGKDPLEVKKIISGTSFSKEKGGRKKQLLFTGACHFVSIMSQYANLRAELKKLEDRAEAARKEAEREEKQRLKKEAKEKAETKIDVDGLPQRPVHTIEGAQEGAQHLIGTILNVMQDTTIPELELSDLVPVPRRRNTVQLDVPPTWTGTPA